MNATTQCFYLICLVGALVFLFSEQKRLAMEKIQQLQPIGTMYNVEFPNDSWKLFFHTLNQSFVVSPEKHLTSFYQLEVDNVKHGCIVQFRQKTYQIELDGRE